MDTVDYVRHFLHDPDIRVIASLLEGLKPGRGRAFLEVCDASGVRELDLLQRADRALFKELEDMAGKPLLFDARIEGKRIVELTRRMT